MTDTQIQKILAKGWLSPNKARQLSLVRDAEYGAGNEFGLSTSTNNYCGEDDVDKSDFSRRARAQRFWESPDETSKYVGHEIVLYESGGVEKYLDSLVGTPDRCPKVRDGETVVTWPSSTGPAGLPEGATAIGQRVVWDSGFTKTGYIVAVSSGEVVGIAYVLATDASAADALTVSLVKRLAKKVEKIDAKLA